MKSRVWSLLVVAAVFPAEAQADWQYVKWGASKKATIAASKGEARAVNNGPNVGCAFDTQIPFAFISRKNIGGFDFDITLCTEGSDKVTSVALRPAQGTNLPTLRRALISQYGQPVRSSGDDIWTDRKNGNVVTYSETGGVVATIEYKKLDGGGL